MILLAIALATCAPALIYDADTLTCTDGTKLRIAGGNAQEIKGNPCPRNFPCPPMRAVPAREVLVRMLGATVIGQRKTGHLIVQAPVVTYRVVGRSGDRLVAVITLRDGRDLRCEMQAVGALAEWARFVRRYGLGGCP